jgi:hypothetical protein
MSLGQLRLSVPYNIPHLSHKLGCVLLDGCRQPRKPVSKKPESVPNLLRWHIKDQRIATLIKSRLFVVTILIPPI